MIESFHSSVEMPEGSGGGLKTPEDSSSKKEKDSKKKSATKEIGRTIIEPPKEIRQAERIKSIFASRDLLETAKAENPFKADAGKKAEKTMDTDTPHIEAVDAETSADKDGAKREDFEKETKPEEFTPEEQHEVVARITRAEKENLAEEAVRLTRSSEEEGNEEHEAIAGNAAGTILMDTIEEKLAENPKKPVGEVLNEAEAVVEERINEEDGESGPDEEVAEVIPLHPSGAPESVPEDADAEDAVVIPLHPSGSTTPPTAGGAGGGGAVPPGGRGPAGPPPPSSPGGPTPGPGGPLPGPGGGPNRGRNPVYAPYAPMYGGGYPGGPGGPNAASFNTAPAAANIAPRQDIEAERRAQARGLLVGLIVGYVVGRRRGRIKTEKKLKPIQQKLEKQVEGLYDTVAYKEQNIRTLAAEKARALQTAEEKSRFAYNLMHERQEAAAASQLSNARTSPERQSPVLRAETGPLSRVHGVETAAAAVVGSAAAIRQERIREINDGSPEPAIDFSKKVEAYTTKELDRAAEKIKIGGESLKDLARARGLNERAVRRVVKEFVEGGNVKEALAREMTEKELQFERDPRMRQAQGGQGSSASGGASAASVNTVHSVQSEENGAGSPGSSMTKIGSGPGITGAAGVNGKRPVPDQATLHRLRQQQAMQIVTITVGLVMLAIALIVLLA